jgi:tetratricopeptide (TPR) repeat protein
VSSRAALIALAIATARIARADPEADADRAFRQAEQHAAAGDPRALDELEALGAARPETRWTAAAWAEAARLAERAGDYARAQRDLEQVLATTHDDQLARRAHGDLARLAGVAGATGQWGAVAAQHDRLEARLGASGDPKPTLRELEAMIEANPGYPRAWSAMIAVAHGWERDGDAGRALGWLHRARDAAPAGADRVHASAELARTLIRHGGLAEARTEIDAIPDAALATALRGQLARAETRRTIRWLVAGLLVVLLTAAIVSLRRVTGSWRAVMRRLVRPPAEVIYLVPIALVFVIVAQMGNPLVASAVRVIAIAGVAIAWLSGVTLEAVRQQRGRIRLPRAASHALAALLAVAGSAYLAIDRDRVIDLVIETWHEGPQMR